MLILGSLLLTVLPLLEAELLARLGLEADLGVRDGMQLGTSKIMQAKEAEEARLNEEKDSKWHVAASDKCVPGMSAAVH